MLQKNEIISRIAPTPSGNLHLGNAYNFAYTYILTKSQKGLLHLRIDDIDGERTRLEYIENIFRTLEWLKIDWDFGPLTPDDFTTSYSQLDKIDHYRKILKTIERETYPCCCTRKGIKEKYQDGIYRGACKDEKIDYIAGSTSLRLNIPEKEESFRNMGHPVVWRKDDIPSYQLVSVIEDEEMKINTIVRGEDLIDSTHIQLFLANRLSYTHFRNATFKHHPLLLDSNGKKLSKSNGALSMKEMIENGLTHESFLTGLSDHFKIPSGSSLNEMIQRYSEK
ncbi:MAG: hypothetical protein KAG61_07960 [Bacteriovoracaceae bacterium]|nr:hypothetical protein [Bacteriovoracaceae bacterium]